MSTNRDPFPGYSAVDVLDAWDAVRERQARTIDAEPIGFWQAYRASWRAYRARWRAAPLHVAMIAIILAGFVLPMAILIGGIVGLAIWTAIFG